MANKGIGRELKPIEECPNGHYYNTSRTGDTCDVCGTKLDPPEDLPDDELVELTHVEEDEWVCGWLACTKGLNKGRGYEIRNRRNLVGSSSVMDIQIIGDKKIDKKNHAQIVYDPKTTKIHLVPGTNRGLVYLQEQLVFEPVEMEPFNSVQFGESVFTFVPLCGEAFDWYKLKD